MKKKREEAKSTVTYYAGISAANGLNPIPGVNVAVDVGVLVTLFSHIRKMYGLTDSNLEKYQKLLNPALQEVLNNVVKFATEQGILILLKRFPFVGLTKTIITWIPFVGQLVAGSAGFIITKSAGDSYVDDCHKLASEILEQELKDK